MTKSKSPIPLYYRIKMDIEEKIRAGNLRPGEKLPSENDLCQLFGVSRTTVRQAVNELVISGKLYRVQGKGTFISELSAVKPFYSISGFTSDMRHQGFAPTSRVLVFKPLIPEFAVSQALGLGLEEPAILLKRLRYANNEIVGLDNVHMPFKRFSDILPVDFSKHSLYKYIQENLNVVPVRSLNFIEAIICDEELAELLQVEPGFPVLKMTETVYDQNNVIFEYSIAFYRADRYMFNVEIDSGNQDRLKAARKFQEPEKPGTVK